MFCTECGKQIDDNARFCPECGAKTASAVMGATAANPVQTQFAPNSQYAPIQGRQITENIFLCSDGVYRWAYEYKLMKNPTILITILKAMGLSLGITFVLIMVMIIINDGFDDFFSESTLGFIGVFLVIIAVVFFITFLGYFIYAAISGWKYTVMFEMDDYGVTHKQMDQTVKKSEVIREIGMWTGLLTGSLSTTGAALMIRTSMRSEFRSVKSIQGIKRRSTIKVNEVLEKNQVYADGADYDFVYNFIRQRIPPNAIVK